MLLIRKLIVIFTLFLCGFCSFIVEIYADTHTATSCSLSNVTAAYNAASVGDVVAMPAGNCSWSTGLTITKGIALQGAGVDATTIINTGTRSLIDISVSSNVTVRITGIYFDNVSNNDSRNAINVNGKTDGSFGLTKLRIHNNTFNKGARAVHVKGWVYGLLDNNTFINSDVAVGITGDNNYSWSRPIIAGTADALFIEDNTFIIDNNADREPNEQIYHQEGGRTVVRYNTFDGTSYTAGNSLFFDSHGNQNYYVGTNADFRGQPILEIYGNTFSSYKTYRMIYLRGGSVLFWGNTLTNAVVSPDILQATDEESWQTAFFSVLATKWSAQDQINNSFFWNNTYNEIPIADIVLRKSSDSTFIQKDRDYFMHAPQSSGGKSTYYGRAGGEMTFSSEGANAYYPYEPYTYPHPSRSTPNSPLRLR
ncbi:MAG: hypothetical protein A2W05_00375 [Candidatus Schekmanbacteria bacterium RBG_16_38_10]|uniref:Right handed beta helix domain-containing protein n=1 Tax=Candidatus Schekmanbacteria bacterium RBG_16_38_10 TaxID=1817879 RepID=A0A1F7RPI3_9BACT|nr:MAG: hypothetical protein A2W05_00375 [Candidatus Schekmanbacteria bacterium RBG_16_38_10]